MPLSAPICSYLRVIAAKKMINLPQPGNLHFDCRGRGNESLMCAFPGQFQGLVTSPPAAEGHLENTKMTDNLLQNLFDSLSPAGILDRSISEE